MKKSGSVSVTAIAWAIVRKWALASIAKKSKQQKAEAYMRAGARNYSDALSLLDASELQLGVFATSKETKKVKSRSWAFAMSLANIYRDNGDKFVSSHVGAWL